MDKRLIKLCIVNAILFACLSVLEFLLGIQTQRGIYYALGAAWMALGILKAWEAYDYGKRK